MSLVGRSGVKFVRTLNRLHLQRFHHNLCSLTSIDSSPRHCTHRNILYEGNALIPTSFTANRFYAKGKKKAAKSGKSESKKSKEYEEDEDSLVVDMKKYQEEFTKCKKSRDYKEDEESDVVDMKKHQEELDQILCCKKNKDYDVDEDNEVVDMKKYQEELEQILDGLRQDFIQNMALRTSFASFDKLIIKTDDGKIPLNQIAAITQKSPTLVMIDLNKSRKYVADVLEALQNSSMNLNPQQEKTHTIFINIPKVSREHRENMAKGAKTKFNETKEKMSKVYSKYLKQVNAYINNKGDRDLGEDAKEQLLTQMRQEVDKAETLMKNKQKELLS